MNKNIKELRKDLGIDEYLELLKEDKNLNGAYVSFGQYIDILEKRIEKTLNKIENLRMEKWSITGTDIMDVMSLLEGDNNE